MEPMAERMEQAKMTDLIIEKLITFEKQFNRLESKMDGIEKTIQIIAVQTERIDNNSKDISMLWIKHDEEFGPSGIVTQIKQWQASCPRDSIDRNMKQFQGELHRQWAVIGLLATLIVSIAIAVFRG